MTEACNRCRQHPRFGALSWCRHCLTKGLDPAAAERIVGTGEWVCRLPFPPSTNNLFSQGVVRGKMRRFPTRQYKAWRTEAVTRIRASWRTCPPFSDPVVVKLELIPKDARARDADNYCKPVLDSLVEAQVLIDDSNRWVKAVAPFWSDPQPTSGVIVTIRAARQEQPAKPKLNKTEAKVLTRIKRHGCELVSPQFRESTTLKKLIEKGYVRRLPGLIDDATQGYAPADS